MNSPQAHGDLNPDMNRAARARVARFTYGLSPVSIVNAFTGWLR